MPTPYQTFLASMEITYEKWHDGIGFDLEALAKVSKAERKSIETLLINKADADWRYLEALGALDSPKAWLTVVKVARSGGPQALYAAKMLKEKKPDASPDLVEGQLLNRIRTIGINDGVGEILNAARENPTDAVKAALLNAARFSVNPTFRAHAAATLVYLAGIAKEPWDNAYRPLFHKFSNQIPRTVAEGYKELCELLGIQDPGANQK